jgi:hypothetical protein
MEEWPGQGAATLTSLTRKRRKFKQGLERILSFFACASGLWVLRWLVRPGGIAFMPV